MNSIDELLHLQAGVVARRQAVDLGLRPHDLERLVRRREWARLLPGVFVDHTGPPSWGQRAWAGVLHSWPAALSHESALRAHAGNAGPADGLPIHLAVAQHRHVRPADGYRLHRIAHFDDAVRWNLGPPRVSVEDATIDVAAAARTPFAAFEVLAEACRSRRTTPRRLAATARSRTRLRRRRWLLEVLDDLAAGACSVLERGYLQHVERGHRLPAPKRQHAARSPKGARYRDVDYPAYGLVVELDGRMFHDSTRERDRDLERDLGSAVQGRTTIRLGWGQVFERSCRTAGSIGTVLQQLGWIGAPAPCGPACLLRPAD